MKYGLIGEHLPHSFSKIIHEQIGLYEYELHEVSKEGLDEFMTKRDFEGINVTIPYKQAVIPYLYEISDRAKKIGAVNTIVNKDGKLYGDNTDFGGMQALTEHMGLSLEGKKVIVLGTGGTSKTAYAVAQSLGAKEVYKVSRGKKEGTITYEELCKDHADAEVFINTTPCGMFPNSYEQAVDLSGFKRLEGVVDAVYNPLRSMIVQQAEDLGAKAQGGLYMLVAQAVLAAEIFTGKPLKEGLIDRIYKSLLAEKQNIVLIGMPGAGKTTIGKFLARKTGCQLIDSDKVIVKEQKKEITQIFEEVQEKGFRDIETEVIKRISKENGNIIATGGGAVLREENVKALRTNGVLVFIDRDMRTIKPTKSRPLSNNIEKLLKLYEVRYPIYKKAADIHINNESTAQKAADDICKALGIK